MASARAPKQWSLSKRETLNSYESWRQNLLYTLSLDASFAPFLATGFTWFKYAKDSPNRGFTADADPVPEAARKTAAQKAALLELLLGQIANYCPVIARNVIVKKSTSLDYIWQVIRAHYGFQSTGAHVLDAAELRLEPDERYEDLYQRMTAFVEDNLLKKDGGLTHLGEAITEDEEMSPSLENLIVVMWLSRIHPDLPRIVKQRYGTELRSRTLASIKPEISQALHSLLELVESDAKVMRLAASKPWTKTRSYRAPRNTRKSCPICKTANRPDDHYLSQCTHLPDKDRRYITKARRIAQILDEYDDTDSDADSCEEVPTSDITHVPTPHEPSPTIRKVQVCSTPYIDVFYRHKTPRITIDSGATANLVRKSTADWLGLTISKSTQAAGQADGTSQLDVVGETQALFTFGKLHLAFQGLVATNLDTEILAGTPFMVANDVHIRPSRKEVRIGDDIVYRYGSSISHNETGSIRRACLLRCPAQATTVWPGEYLELDIPNDYAQQDTVFALEPRSDAPSSQAVKPSDLWPPASVIVSVAGKVRIVNEGTGPKVLKRNEHLCQVRPVYFPSAPSETPQGPTLAPIHASLLATQCHSAAVSIDPGNMLFPDMKSSFDKLLREYDEVFNPMVGCYNGKSGPFQSVVNMGPVQPPQRKGRLPQYNRSRLTDLQDKFDELESMGVIKTPESINVTVEYLNPSFLVKKQNGGFRLVTAFAEVGQYSKPQPSLMPDVDSTLRKLGQWKFLIVSDLTKAFYQIPLSRESMKYCGVATPFKGTRVYTRCAMGMPGSETALEELMCRVLGDLLQEGAVVKIADDLYCGGNTQEELLQRWSRTLECIRANGLRLSPTKTIICPHTTTILGWVWHNGTLRASPHRIATLSTCERPTTVKGLRSFMGALKAMSRVIPKLSHIMSPLETLTAGKLSQESVQWSTATVSSFLEAQQALKSSTVVTMPQEADQLWIVTDGAVRVPGIGATLYCSRAGKLHVCGFFSAKPKPNQTSWLPCEVEALAIACATKHFSPYIVSSSNTTHILTDSKPCVQAYQRLCRGKFSTSPRLTTFLSAVSRYHVTVRHLPGAANLSSDFASRNAPDCHDPRCQVCDFVRHTSDCPVYRTSITDLLSERVRLPFTTRSTWLSLQAECHDLRRVCAHLRQGTRPSRKATDIRDVKRYLQVATISPDGLLVVKRPEALASVRESIIVPRAVLPGLVTALHIKLNHPTTHQLQCVMNRYFYALDLQDTIAQTTSGCHQCASLRLAPIFAQEQTTSDPPEALGLSFAADVLRRSRQYILVIRETTTSYTNAVLISDERRDTLRDAILCLCLDKAPRSGPPAVIRSDGAPGFSALASDTVLRSHNIVIEVGHPTNVNRNPVAEKAVQELETEMRRLAPRGEQFTSTTLAIAIAQLNSRLRAGGLSARELWYQRDQYTNTQLPVSDRDAIAKQHEKRSLNHSHSEQCKSRGQARAPECPATVGDIVYLYSDKSKHCSRDRYLVTTVDGAWCNVRKFVGNQLRNTSYRVKRVDMFKVMPAEEPAYATEPDSGDEDTTQVDSHESYHGTSSQSVQSAINERAPSPVSSTLTPHDQCQSVNSDSSRQMSPPTQPHVVESAQSPPVTAETGPPPQRHSRRRRRPAYLSDYET